jgi:hypothetical protein
LNCHFFTPGFWVMGWDWTRVKLKFSALNTGQCWWA